MGVGVVRESKSTTMPTDNTDSSETESADDPDGIERRLERLETQLEEQQETIESQQDRIEEQAAIIEEQRERLNDEDDRDVLVNRRTALKAGGVLGLLGLGAGSASADPEGQIGTNSNPLNKLYTAEINSDSNGLTVNTGSSDRRILDLGTPTSGVDIRGTTGEAGGNVVAGHPANEVQNSASGVTISGGGAASIYKNIAGGDGAVVGGGARNEAIGDLSTVGGGYNNSATSLLATVLGGEENTADGEHSVATGFKADTNGNDGAFVVADSTGNALTAQNADEVRFQANGGFVVENGNVDLNGNNLETSSGGLTITTEDNGNIELNPGSSNEIDVKFGTLDLNGNNLETSSGTLTITTNNNGNLTLDPGSNNEIDLEGSLDVNSNNVNNVASIDNGNSAISVDDVVNLSNSDSIQDSGTDAIQFDGSQNVSIPNGNLDLSSGDKMSLPKVTSDPSASPGDMWYRSDLD